MSLALWRISNYRTLNGVGGLKYSARWHTRGRPIVYLAETPSGAMLETLVHLDVSFDEVPALYTLLRAEADDSAAVESIPVSGSAWRTDKALTRRLGDEWLGSGRTALARVPSAIVPETWNYLLNPLHARAEFTRITDVFQERYDLRLLGVR